EHEILVVAAGDGGCRFLCTDNGTAVVCITYRRTVRQIARDFQRFGGTVINEAAVFQCDAGDGGRCDGQVCREYKVLVIITGDGGRHFLYTCIGTAVVRVTYGGAIRQCSCNFQ